MLKSLEPTVFTHCVCVCACACVCWPRLCALVYVGGRNIGLLAASFPQVLSNGDKGVACGEIDRRMLCLFRRGDGLQPRHRNEREGTGSRRKKQGEFTRGERWWRQQRGVKGRERDEGGLLGGEERAGEKSRWKLQREATERHSLCQEGCRIPKGSTHVYSKPC